MDIAIIGGGASGMMLAAMLDTKINNLNVTIFERNSKLGKKLLLTGNGKCNFTSGEFENLSSIYNSKFAQNIYLKYNNKSFLEFFKSIGIESRLEIHKGLKYFYPKSNKSTSVYYNLLDKIISNGVNIKYDSLVHSIKKNNDKFVVKLKSGDEYFYDKIVIATGGKSYKNTGSDGCGYDFAKSFSHKIIVPIPGLTSLKIEDHDIKALKGVRVDAKVLVKNHNEICETGEVQFTEFGLSGIPILNISSKIDRMISNGEKIVLCFDFMLNHDDLKTRIKNIYYKKQSDFLCGMIPDELGRLIMKKSKATLASDIKNLDNDVFDNITNNLNNFEIEISSYSDFDTAQITIGGVDTSDVKIENLESKLVDGLFFTGEVLDIDGKCGGYNLQLAYSTARCVYGGLLCKQI